MGARFPPARGSAVDCPESSEIIVGPASAIRVRGDTAPCPAREETEVRPPAGDAWACLACSAAGATAASAPAQGHGVRSPAADAFERTSPAPGARGGCTPVQLFGGAADLGADVLATNADGFLVVIPGKHCADGNRVGSQDLRHFGGTCFAVQRPTWRSSSPPAPPPHPPRRCAATCGMVCGGCGALAAWTVGRTLALAGGRQRARIADVHGVTAHCSWGVRSRMRPPVTGHA
jgi:hypothetical protein